MQANLSLDRTILSYALHNKQFAMELSNNITHEYFHTDMQWLFKATMDYFNNPKFKELPTLNIISEYLEKNYQDKAFISSGKEVFKEISELETNPAEFKWNIEKLKTRYNDQIQRVCAANITKLIRDNNESQDDRIAKVNDVLRGTITAIDSIQKTKAYQEGSLSQSARSRAQKYKEVEANPELAQGIFSGFGELDRITNGMHPGELLIVGGPTSSGKSVVMMNMAINAYIGKQNPMENAPTPEECIRGHNVLYFSLEMPKDNQERRIDSCIAQVPYNDIRDGKLSIEDKERYFKGLKFQDKYHKMFYIVDMPRGVTVREIELKYLEMKETYGISFDLVVVDYIGIMKSSKSADTTKQDSDWLELGHIAEELHEFARVYNIPVITATQVNRPKDPNKQQYSTDRVARSDMIPQNANIILQIGSRGDDEHTRLDMPVYITKMRDGEKGSFTLVKEFSKMRVVDMVDATFTSGTSEDDDELV